MSPFLALIAGWLLVAAPAAAAERVALQLKWVPQAQFAGYYLAKHQGLYQKEGLDVSILPGGPNISPVKVIRDGRADVIVNWMGDALAAREKGTPLVNIAQVFKRSGLMLTCRRDAGIRSPADLKGRVIGVWFHGNEYPFLNWMNVLGFPTTDGTNGVTVLMQGFNADPLLRGAASCISTMNYNEYWQVIDGGLRAEDLIVFRYQDQGAAVLEDGLYVLEGRLQEAGFQDRMARFLRASLQGWEAARVNPEAAIDALMSLGKLEAKNRAVQTRMLGDVLKLVAGPTESPGLLATEDYQRTVKVLLTGGSQPVISREPVGAWTHAIWERAASARVGSR